QTDSTPAPVVEEEEQALLSEMAEAESPVPEGETEAEPRRGIGRWFRKKDKPAPAEEGDEVTPAPVPEKKRWIARLTERLMKTRQWRIGNIRSILGMSGKLDDDTIEEIEAALSQSDVSVETAVKIVERMKAEVKKRGGEPDADQLLDIF